MRKISLKSNDKKDDRGVDHHQRPPEPLEARARTSNLQQIASRMLENQVSKTARSGGRWTHPIICLRQLSSASGSANVRALLLKPRNFHKSGLVELELCNFFTGLQSLGSSSCGFLSPLLMIV